jgi:glycosyltransferase involved in cell wall biosynthesis
MPDNQPSKRCVEAAASTSALTTPVVFDISRLIFDAGRPTPTGIHRIELAYAQHLLATRPAQVTFVARSLWGRMAEVGRRQAGWLIGKTAALWAGTSTQRLPVLVLRGFFFWAHFTLLWRSERLLHRRLRGGNRPAVYILVSHYKLDRPAAMRRLKRNAGARLFFFIHDLIPLQFPEFVTPGTDRRWERRLRTVVQLADAVLVHSRHIAEELKRELAPNQRLPQIVAIPPGVVAPKSAIAAAPSPAQPYFVIVGTIEPRKNHLMLLNVWRQLRGELQHDAPKLIVIGRRGWENENIIDMLDRSRALDGFVEERNRISDRELAVLIGGAQALLMPSFVEGFGLPLAEALAAGRPVICSDIQVFREVGSDVPEFIDPLDGPSWRQAIIDYMDERSPRRDAQLERMKDWAAPSWDEHFSKLAALIATTR